MNDYNRGALPDPCLRLDYGFGEQWASVELGDGTGYVRLADYEILKSENAKLRDAMYTNAGKHALQHMDEDELRIWATQQAVYVEELKELARDLRLCSMESNCLRCEHGRICDLRLDERYKELGIEEDE